MTAGLGMLNRPVVSASILTYPTHKTITTRVVTLCSCDIGNYREITQGSHTGKVSCSVLNARLSEAMESKVLGEAQGGFRRNRRTTDQGFVVSGIVYYWANKKKPRQENLDGVLRL